MDANTTEWKLEEQKQNYYQDRENKPEKNEQILICVMYIFKWLRSQLTLQTADIYDWRVKHSIFIAEIVFLIAAISVTRCL